MSDATSSVPRPDGADAVPEDGRLAAPTAILRLPADLGRQMSRWAAAGYPYEVCGLLVGRRDGERAEAVRAIRADNLDRERPETRYTLDPDDFLAADREARAGGLDVVGFWHSHPDHPPQPSPTDFGAAWEGYSYLIVATTAAGAGEMRSWRLAGNRFREETIEVLEAKEPSP